MNLVYLRQSKTRKRLVLMQLKHRQEIKLHPQRKRWLHLRASYLIGSSFLESHRERPNNLMIYTCDVRKKFRRVEAARGGNESLLSWVLPGPWDSEISFSAFQAQPVHHFTHPFRVIHLRAAAERTTFPTLVFRLIALTLLPGSESFPTTSRTLSSQPPTTEESKIKR